MIISFLIWLAPEQGKLLMPCSGKEEEHTLNPLIIILHLFAALWSFNLSAAGKYCLTVYRI